MPVDIPLPTTYFALFAALVMGMQATMIYLIKRIVADQDAISRSLAAVNTSLTIHTGRFDAAATVQGMAVPFMAKMEANIEFIKSAIVNSTIVPPSVKAEMHIRPAQPETPEERTAMRSEQGRNGNGSGNP